LRGAEPQSEVAREIPSVDWLHTAAGVPQRERIQSLASVTLDALFVWRGLRELVVLAPPEADTQPKDCQERGDSVVKKSFFVLALAALAAGANAVALWDQLGAIGYGFASQDFEPAYDAYDCMVADDFEVTAPGWRITNIEFDMILQYGNSVPVHGVNIRFMPARADNTGDYWNPVYTEASDATTRMIYNGTNSVDLVTPVILGPGHYFVGVAPHLDWEHYGQCYFAMNSFPVWNQMALMINPGGGFGMGSDWFAPAPGYDASFRLNTELWVPEPGVVSLSGLLLGAGAAWLRSRQRER
jgi:hypothetical protein